jgi:hypothetical protein
MPGNISVNCDQVPEPISLSYSNGLLTPCTIEGSVPAQRTGTYSPCGYVLTDTWTFTDPCGRGTTTHSRTITVGPSPEATFTSTPPNIQVACGAIPAPSSLSYTNNGAGGCLISGSVTSTQTSAPGVCGGTVTETWTFTDACQRTITKTRTITVAAAPQAQFATAQNLTIPCGSAPPAGTSLSYTNGGAGACLISGTVTGVITGSHTACGGTYTETWTFIDACQRTSTRTRTITVEAAPQAQFATAQNLTIPCD